MAVFPYARFQIHQTTIQRTNQIVLPNGRECSKVWKFEHPLNFALQFSAMQYC